MGAFDLYLVKRRRLEKTVMPGLGLSGLREAEGGVSVESRCSLW